MTCIACRRIAPTQAGWTWTLLGSLCPVCGADGHIPGYRAGRSLHVGVATCTCGWVSTQPGQIVAATRCWRRHHAEHVDAAARNAQAVRDTIAAVAAAIIASAAGGLSAIDDPTMRVATAAVRALSATLGAENARRVARTPKHGTGGAAAK